MNILILYDSVDGQTKAISERIVNTIRVDDHQVTIHSGEKLPSDFSVIKYDAAIIGDCIRVGKYPSYIRKFVTKYVDWLNSVPSAFFTVCMAINSKHANSREQALKYGDNFLSATGWQPKLTKRSQGQ